MNKKVSAWIAAARPRTLPLTLASILMGSFLAAKSDGFNWAIFGLSILTTIFLQILSNLANDYGDSVHGADGAHRQGPQRAVSSGEISPSAMKKAIVLLIALSLVAGVSLLYVAFGFDTKIFGFFFVLGLLCIAAAISYTMGKKPYGYAGLGDVSVLIFFGLVGVLGTFYLHTHKLPMAILLPALSCGLFATGVLNVNNIRDIESDRAAGKKSIPVRLGRKKAVNYHYALILGGLSLAIAYNLLQPQSIWQWMFLVTVPLFWTNLKAVSTKLKASELDPYLKQLAITALLFAISFGLGQIIS